MISSMLFQIILALTILISVTNSEKQSIYEILREHGLPMGLLPKGVKEFDIDSAGHFEVRLDQACNAKFESELHYERNVSGTLSYGQIGNLTGISAQELFLWFQVKGIRVDVPSSGLIYFDVGVVFKQFSLSLFEAPRDCMAGQAIGLDDEIRDGKFLKEAVSEIQSETLRYQLDHGHILMDIL